MEPHNITLLLTSAADVLDTPEELGLEPVLLIVLSIMALGVVWGKNIEFGAPVTDVEKVVE